FRNPFATVVEPEMRRRKSPRLTSFRPLVEQLEDRVTPAITAATGGVGLSADNAVNGFTPLSTLLTGPVDTESVTGDVHNGALTLTAPTGFRFDTNFAVSVNVSRVSGNSALDVVGTITTFNSSTITFTTTQQSNGQNRDALTWVGIHVQATSAFPLA